MRRIKKLCSIVLAAAMIVSGIPCLSTGRSADEGRIAYAAEEETSVASGSCGAAVTWNLDFAGTLTIRGTGAMENYYHTDYVPWKSVRTTIKKVVVEDGVTSIGWFAFYYCTNLTTVELADSVTNISIYAFYNCKKLEHIKFGNGLKTIEELALWGTSLTEITFPASLTSLGASALADCASLKRLTFLGAAPSLGSNVFSNASAMNIICSFSQSGWNTAKETWAVPSGTTWYNADDQLKPSEFRFEKNSYEVTQGQSLTLATTANDLLAMDLIFSSDRPECFFVGKGGAGAALQAGSCTVTAKTADGAYTATCTVTVKDSSVGKSGKFSVIEPDGTISKNISTQNLGRYGAADWSYLYQKDDGSYTRVEWLQEAVYANGSLQTTQKIAVVNYSADFVLQSHKLIAPELNLFGGIFHGKQYNFLVFGQNNPSENVSTEVVRVIKYDQDWNRLGACSITGANTSVPFDAGSLEMTESGGKLYIHTCHEMFKSKDGYNHQANMTFVIDQASMGMLDSYYDVMNIGYGYVSHSFNQKLRTDETSLFRVDHGDAYPRSIVITKVGLSRKVSNVEKYLDLWEIAGGTGNNNTGVTLGDFELSSDFCVVAGSSVVQDASWNYNGQKNIFLAACDKNLSNRTTTWVTNYGSDANVFVGTPHLVKLSSDAMLLMWEEGNYKDRTTKMTLVSGDGKTTTGITELPIRLSDCQPIVNNQGRVVWYVTNQTDTAVFYQINPYNMLEGLTEIVTPTPTATATVAPTPTATATVAPTPTAKPTAAPTVAPTPKPAPTATPTATVTVAPTPTAKPTAAPTVAPTPTSAPTATPTATATVAPTPTVTPTSAPTATPTATATVAPAPTATPTATPIPTAAPTAKPVPVPTEVPTVEPTAEPTEAPTDIPTEKPTEVPVEIMYGDVDGNGKVDASDALAILKVVVRLTALEEHQVLAADVDGNGIVEAADALNVLKKVVHLIEVFTVEEKDNSLGW